MQKTFPVQLQILSTIIEPQISYIKLHIQSSISFFRMVPLDPPKAVQTQEDSSQDEYKSMPLAFLRLL